MVFHQIVARLLLDMVKSSFGRYLNAQSYSQISSKDDTLELYQIVAKLY